jgi:hypothetical protein
MEYLSNEEFKGMSYQEINWQQEETSPNEPEELLEGNFGEMRAELWREFCLRDPCRFKKRTYTGGDKLFWIGGQKTMWDEHYSDNAYFKRGWVVHQHALHLGHYNNHIHDDFDFMDECMRKLGVLELADFKYDYYPDVIR